MCVCPPPPPPRPPIPTVCCCQPRYRRSGPVVPPGSPRRGCVLEGGEGVRVAEGGLGAVGRALRGCRPVAQQFVAGRCAQPRCGPCRGMGMVGCGGTGRTTRGGGHLCLYRCHRVRPVPRFGEPGGISRVGLAVRRGAWLRVGVV